MKNSLLTLFILLLSVAVLNAQPPDINRGLVAYYPFNGNANDESGNGNHGVLNGGVRLSADRFGNPCNAYNFNSGYIEVNNSPTY